MVTFVASGIMLKSSLFYFGFKHQEFKGNSNTLEPCMKSHIRNHHHHNVPLWQLNAELKLSVDLQWLTKQGSEALSKLIPIPIL